MIRDVLYCGTHPFQCIGDALAGWWWLIAIFAGLIIIGFLIRAGRAAYAVAGWPGVVGALGIIGTVIVALVTALTRRSADPEPSEVDGPDAAPSPRPRPQPKPPRPKREDGGPIFPNAPWNRRK